MAQITDNQRYVAAAQARQKYGELEIDDTAIISKGEDEGAYVQAWIWVTDEEAGIAHSEEKLNGIP